MNNSKLSFYGIGPKIARIMLPWMVLTIVISLIFRNSFAFFNPASRILNITGIIFIVTGFALYFSTLPLLLRGIKETRLITNGAFKVCVNPLYASILLFILPGTSFLMNSWLVLSVSVVGYILFRIHIKDEYREMEKIFGEEYVRYKKNTPEFFPFPVYKKVFKN